MNALDDYLASCAGNATALSYDALLGFVGALNASADCFDYVLVAAAPYTAAACSSALHYVASYAQTAANPSVALGAGPSGMTTPYSCLRANASFCPQQCQADIDIVAIACHAEDSVRWDGLGLPGAIAAPGAPKGTTVSPAVGWALFVNGTAAAPVNTAAGLAANTPLPLTLTACINAGGVFPYHSPPPSPPPPNPPPPWPPFLPGPPQIRMEPLLAPKASPDDKFVLNATVYSWAPADTLRLQWSAAPALSAAAMTPLTQRAVVLPPGALVANGTYVFTLGAQDSLGPVNASLVVPVAARPSGIAGGLSPTLIVSAASGIAFTDTFVLTTTGWMPNEYVPTAAAQLEFAFSYTRGEAPDAPAVLLAGFGPAANTSCLLPAGNITFAVVARNAFGAQSVLNVTARAMVTLPSGITDATALLGSASSAAAAALSGGNPSGAASLVGAMAQLLSDPAATSATSPAAQQEARGNLLSMLDAIAAVVSSPGALAAAAAAAAAVVNTPLSAANANAAVGVLSVLAAAPGGTMSAAAADSLAGAVSSLAAGGGTAVLGALGGVVSSLSASLAAQLSAPGQFAVVSSPQVQLVLQLVDPTAPGAAVFSQPITAPGSVAAVSPLPAAALAGATGPVLSTFQALSFDPNVNAGADACNGVVSLSFAGVSVANLNELITLDMPSARVADGLLAMPAFWNQSAKAYSSAGVVALPNPAPPATELAIDWVLSFNASSDDVLPLSWNVSGPAAGNCTDAWLDCGVAEQRTRVVTTCPGDARSQSWSCSGATTGLLRIWTGCACMLWRPPPADDAIAAASWCSWNVSTQSFAGAGCVLSNVTRVGTRHLTAFTVQAQPPEIRTLSAKDLVSISPEDLVHIKELLIIVCVLFAGMHLTSALLARMDRRDFARMSALAFSPLLGCSLLPLPGGDACDEGAATELWTWRFTQEPLALDEDCEGLVTGTAVAFAGLLGVPYARLACAVPETMLGGRPAKHCVGRMQGLCPSRIEELHSKRLSRRLSQRSSHVSTPREGESPTLADLTATALMSTDALPLTRISALTGQIVCGGGEAAGGDCDLLTLASTAFMHAFLASWCIRGSDEIVAQQRLFLSHYFRGVPDAEARCNDFLRLYATFKEMLIGGSLRASSNWLPKARMWRTILLSNDAGYWDADEHIAFALLANNQAYPPTKLQGFQVVMSLFSGIGSSIVSTLVTGTSASDTEHATTAGQFVANARRTLLTQRNKAKSRPSGGVDAKQGAAASKEAAADDGDKLAEEEEGEKKHGRAAWYDLEGDDAAFTLEDGNDAVGVPGVTDPLSFTAAAILETMPPELMQALQPCGEGDGGGDAALAARIWTTALVAAYIQSTELHSWRVSPRSVPLAQQRTLLDVALGWLEARTTEAAGDRERGEVLLRRLLRSAQAQSTRWAKLHDRRVTTSRGAHVGAVEHGRMQGYNAAANMYVSLVNGHPTVALFAAELSIGFTRWMGFNVLVSAIMAMLVVNIWHVLKLRAARCAEASFLTHARPSCCSTPGFSTAKAPYAATRRVRCWAARWATRWASASALLARAPSC